MSHEITERKHSHFAIVNYQHFENIAQPLLKSVMETQPLFPDLCESRGFQKLLWRAGPVHTDGTQHHHAAIDLVPRLFIRKDEEVVM